MTGYLNLILRLAIWFLLTADVTLGNMFIGLTVALLLPGRTKSGGELKAWLRILADIIVAIPRAYKEAFEMIFRSHRHEDITMERIKPLRTPGLIFLDIFLITFTPKTIVLNYDKKGWYEVHRVCRKVKS